MIDSQARPPASLPPAIAQLRAIPRLVTLSHTVFALPFAASAVVLALARPHLPLTFLRVAAMLLAMVFARTAAMAFNRYVDRDIDAQNPRTKNREVPRGAVSPVTALGVALVSGALFCLDAATLGRWPAILAPLVLIVLFGYSLTKRFTWGAHLVLGLALALAPGGAWIAMGASPEPAIIALMAGVLSWVSGFDVLYSLQDERFDREHGLYSIPARFGTLGAVCISAGLHVITVASLLATGLWLARGLPYFAGVAVVTALLIYEHAIVGRGRLDRIDRAFFDINGYVSIAFFVLTLADAAFRG